MIFSCAKWWSETNHLVIAVSVLRIPTFDNEVRSSRKTFHRRLKITLWAIHGIVTLYNGSTDLCRIPALADILIFRHTSSTSRPCLDIEHPCDSYQSSSDSVHMASLSLTDHVCTVQRRR